MRDGRRYAWRQLVSVDNAPIHSLRDAMLVSGSIHLAFPDLLIGVNPMLFRDGQAHVARMRELILAAKT